MKVPPPPAADSQLNMTPMIDIVFQLILFFLFSLRFKALDYRIESSLPKDRGPNVTRDIPVALPHVRASLYRLDGDDPTKSRTKVKVSGSEWVLPDLSKQSEAARDVVFLSIEAKMRELRPGADVAGEIACPEPTGSLVPHGDVVRILDSFMGAGFADVHFEGARIPLPRGR